MVRALCEKSPKQNKPLFFTMSWKDNCNNFLGKKTFFD